MMRLLYGDRVTRGSRVNIGCSVAIFDASGERLLLTRRVDNGEWCLPGGKMEPGESLSETCLREAKEETGYEIQLERLIGVYSSPNCLIEYPDGNKVQIVVLNFQARIISGHFEANSEVSESKFVTLSDLESVNVFEFHRERIVDAFAHDSSIFIK